jgi:membrane protease YdiL (CAAX protease family)
MWVFGSLLLAAVISPWVYQGGKHLAAVAVAKDVPALWVWLGAACGRAQFSRYFDRSLLASTLVLLPLVLHRIKTLRIAAGTTPTELWARVSWKCAALQLATGCLIAGALLWGLGAALTAGGALAPCANHPATGKLLSGILIPAVAVSLLEEWLFRGLLLGLWLRFARPAAACLGTSLLFAFLHFLKLPEGTSIAEPAHALAGFQLLEKVLLHFTDPLFFVTDFAMLLVGGLILAWARVRTGALWFSIGLHAGWIMVFKGYNILYQSVPGHPLHPWGVGDNLRSGAFPLLTLGITAMICHFVFRRFAARRVLA